MTAARIHRLTLTNFRSYRAAQIAFAQGPVVLTAEQKRVAQAPLGRMPEPTRRAAEPETPRRSLSR